MKCPGQDSRFWKPDAIFEAKCPKCGHTVEFFKDDTARNCSQCGHRFINPNMDFGCASYCKYAEQCIGVLSPELIAQKQDLLKDRVAIEMKRYFGRDFKQIGHTIQVARHAEQIGKQENGDLSVILVAAYLHDIGVVEARRKHRSSAPRYQEQEGPPVAREIMERLGAPEALMEEVCDIIAHHHHPGPEETKNFKCVYDGDLLANLEESQKETPVSPDRVSEIIEGEFLMDSGKALARKTLGPGREGALPGE